MEIFGVPEEFEDFYADLFEDILDFTKFYCEIYRSLMIYGEWPVDGV